MIELTNHEKELNRLINKMKSCQTCRHASYISRASNTKDYCSISKRHLCFTKDNRMYWTPDWWHDYNSCRHRPFDNELNRPLELTIKEPEEE